MGKIISLMLEEQDLVCKIVQNTDVEEVHCFAITSELFSLLIF